MIEPKWHFMMLPLSRLFNKHKLYRMDDHINMLYWLLRRDFTSYFDYYLDMWFGKRLWRPTK